MVNTVGISTLFSVCCPLRLVVVPVGDLPGLVNSGWAVVGGSVWFISIPSCMSVAAIPAMTFEFRAVRKEVENGQYSPVAFLAANTVVQVNPKP